MNDRTRALSDAGVSIWLDDLSRTRLTSGNLADLIAERDVVGVTTNPSIFAAALSQGDAYTEQIRDLKARGTDVEDVITALTTDDVRDACDLFRPIYEKTKGFDGRVSIEVDPRHAHDGAATVAQAKALYELVARPNVLVKIPATSEGLAAITETIAEGISVNVTLIFSVERYSAVLDAYLAGLERAAEQGVDLANIHSVASIFISRVDSEVDERLSDIGATALQGQAAIALAGLCHEVYTNVLASDRWQRLAAAGANPQRPLWASTSTKNPEFRDVIYVEGLITPGVVNTMPEKTLQAFADHGDVSGDVMTGSHAQAHATFEALEAAGIDMPDVVDVLETEGVKKFIDPWVELIATMGDQISKA